MYAFARSKPPRIRAPAAYATALLAGPQPSLPVLLAAGAAVSAPIGIVANGLSRAIERRCDAEAVQSTGDAAAFVDFHRRIALKNLVDPDPPRAQATASRHPPDDTRADRAGAGAGLSSPRV